MDRYKTGLLGLLGGSPHIRARKQYGLRDPYSNEALHKETGYPIEQGNKWDFERANTFKRPLSQNWQDPLVEDVARQNEREAYLKLKASGKTTQEEDAFAESSGLLNTFIDRGKTALTSFGNTLSDMDASIKANPNLGLALAQAGFAIADPSLTPVQALGRGLGVGLSSYRTLQQPTWLQRQNLKHEQAKELERIKNPGIATGAKRTKSFMRNGQAMTQDEYYNLYGKGQWTAVGGEVPKWTPTKLSEMERMIQETYPDNPVMQSKMRQQYIKAKATPQSFNIDQRGETQQSINNANFFNKRAEGVLTEAKLAREQKLNLERMSYLLNKSGSGPEKKISQPFWKALGALGIEVPENYSYGEATQALQAQMAMILRNPDSGAGLPGSASERDVEFLMSAVPSLEKTALGNELIIKWSMKMAEMKLERSRQMMKYMRENGGVLDWGFWEEWGKYVDANSIIEEEDMEKVQQAKVQGMSDEELMGQEQ